MKSPAATPRITPPENDDQGVKCVQSKAHIDDLPQSTRACRSQGAAEDSGPF
jgi:hypothetical protein